MKEKFKIIHLLVLLMPFLIFGQGETNNWYFGFNSGIGFDNEGGVTSLEDGALFSYEGCATISDPSGALLFYTDGETVYNKNHQVMVNGSGLLGSPSSTQSAIIFPMPESQGLFYIFTVDTTNGAGLNFSIVDSALDNGNGVVVQKNTNLLPYCSEKIAAVVKDCTSNAIWVLTLSTENGQRGINPNYNTYYAFEVNATGVVLPGVASTFTALNNTDAQGYLKVSSDGSKLASANLESGLFVYDFDTLTGSVTNQEEIIITAANTFSYGLEFSLSGQYLYVDTRNRLPPAFLETSNLLQFDLFDADISSTQVVLDDRLLFRGALQMGINGKIYRALSADYTTGLPYLGVINNPEEQGLASNYDHNGVLLANNSAQGLPPFVASFFNTIEIVENQNTDVALCAGEPLRLEVNLIAGATYDWEKDGVSLGFYGNIYTIPESDVQDSGNYSVTVLRPRAVECPIIGEINVEVFSLPEAPTLSAYQCDVTDEHPMDGMASFNLRDVQDTADLTYSFYLNENDIVIENPITNLETFINNEAFMQSLLYKVANENGCESQGILELNVYPVPLLELDELYVFCEADTNAQIYAPIGFDAYHWYRIEGDTEQLVTTGETLTEVESGIYSLVAGLLNGSVGNDSDCSRRFTFEVIKTEVVEIIDLNIVDNAAVNTVEVFVNGQGDYEYSFDGITFQDSNFLTNVPSGSLVIYVRDKEGCGAAERPIEIDMGVSLERFPKFFTPNGDGINDFWNYTIGDGIMNDIEVSYIFIYNRYGKLLAELEPSGTGWDGRFNGQKQPAADYWFRAVTFQNSEVQGHFALIN